MDQDLDQMASVALGLKREISEKEAELEELRSKERELLFTKIPNWLNEHGLTAATALRCKISMKTAVHASVKKSLSAEQRELAFNWIRQHGGDRIIQPNVVIKNGSEAYAEELRKVGADAVYAPEVNHQTLSSFMSDLLGVKAGSLAVVTPDEVPAALGLYIENSVTIKETN